MPNETALYQLIQIRLGRDLGDYIATARTEGRSLRRIAADLHAVTGHSVTYEAIRQWEQRTEAGAA